MGAGLAIGASGLISGLGSIIGGGKQAQAAQTAAQYQYQAAIKGQQTELAMYKKGISEIQPFVTGGTNALTALQQLTGTGPGATAQSVLTAPLTTPLKTQYPMFTPTVAGVKATPGYQVQQFIGQNQLKNYGAGQGQPLGGGTGFALAQMETGLNLGTWQNQQNAYIQNVQQQQANTSLELQQRAQIGNLVGTQVGVGSTDAAAALGASVNTGGQIAQLQGAGGAALASGAVGQANALAGITSNIGSTAQNTALAYALSQQGLFGNPNATAPPGTPSVYGSDPQQA